MALTEEKYLSQLDRIQCIFKRASDEIFANSFSREETELHSFYIEESDSYQCIYFDSQKIEKEEIRSADGICGSSFVQDYLTRNLGERNHIYQSTDTVLINGRKRKVYWTLSSECLDSHHGTLILDRLLQQLKNTFIKFVDQALEEQPLNEEEAENDYSVRAAEIIRIVEKDIDECLQMMFKPFQIDWVNILSGEYYERSECQSNLIFLPKGAKEKLEMKDWIYCFEKTPFLPQNSRLIRKWLQMTRNNMNLVLCVDESGKVFNVYGICRIDDLKQKLKNASGSGIPYLKVEIRKHMVWKLFLNDQYIFTFRNGHYKIEREIHEEYLRKRLSEFFGEKKKHNYKTLIKNIIRIAKQDHGTMLVVMKFADARKEADRLGKKRYGFVESNPKVRTDAINNLSAIDGSIIIDTYGRIHGIGIILDGLSSEDGRSERGARYNSAKKYLAALSDSYPDEPIKALAVVISDDGFVDILS